MFQTVLQPWGGLPLALGLNLGNGHSESLATQKSTMLFVFISEAGWRKLKSAGEKRESKYLNLESK